MWQWLKNWFADWKQEVGYRLESRARAGAWPRVRREHLHAQPYCVACGQLAETVHHCVPVSRAPELELDETNLYSYCDRHHLLIGHLGDYHAYNPEQEQAAAINLALVHAYRNLTRWTDAPISQDCVIYRTALALIERQYGDDMTPAVRKAFRTLQRFIEQQRCA